MARMGFFYIEDMLDRSLLKPGKLVIGQEVFLSVMD